MTDLETNNSSRIVMESRGIPIFICFCDLDVSFGEIIVCWGWRWFRHEGESLKERFVSTISMVRWYVEASNLVGSCLFLIKSKLSWFFTCYYVVLMVFITFLFTWFNVIYKNSYMIGHNHGYFMCLLVTERIMDARSNWCQNN